MPTFIKTGYWEKIQKGYKGWLNLEDLIENNSFSGAKSYTYSQLTALKAAGSLVPGAYYIISDYVTKYQIPGTTLINTNVHNGLPYGAMTAAENPPPPVEPLIVMAVAGNKFSSLAYSTVNQNDIIEYDFDNTVVLTETRNGYITNRIDTKNKIQAPYDWRVVRQRRWNINLTNASQRTTAAGILDTTTFAGYFCWFSTATVVGHIDTLTPPNVNDFKDLFTFDTVNFSISNVQLGENASNVVFIGNCVNNTFETKLDGGSSAMTNCTIDSCWYNTFNVIQNSILIGNLSGFEIYSNLINFPIVNTLLVGLQIFSSTTVDIGGYQSRYANNIGWYKVTIDYQTGAGNRRVFIRGMIPTASSVSFRRLTANFADGSYSGSTNTVFSSCYLNVGGLYSKTYDTPISSIGSAATFANLAALTTAAKRVNHQQGVELYSIEQSVAGATVTLTPTKIF